MKEVQFTIIGQGAYSVMKYESGVHRVQRVPETESGGRIHTSTISVAVMPEVDEDIDIVIEDKDIRLAYESPCYGKPLPLSAGQVASSLLDNTFKAALGFNNITAYSKPYGLHKFFIVCLVITPS